MSTLSRITTIAEYLEYPRFGQCHSATERVSGVGPCVQIFGKRILCRPEDFDRIMSRPHTNGKKLFDDDDNIKFLINVQAHLYVALSGRAISVFDAMSMISQATKKLCDDDDEIIGHGKIEDFEHTRAGKGRSDESTKTFNLFVVFKSGCVRRLSITVVSNLMSFEMTIDKGEENKSAAGTLIAAPIMDKTNLVMIYNDTIVKADKSVCRGTPAEGRQVVFAAGTPWKSKIFLVTDDGEVHYAKMTGKVGDGEMPLFGTGKVTNSSELDIKEPTAFAVWNNKEVVVGNENGDMYRLDKKDFNCIDEYHLGYGPITFLQGHGEDLWIGSKTGVMQNYDEIC